MNLAKWAKSLVFGSAITFAIAGAACGNPGSTDPPTPTPAIQQLTDNSGSTCPQDYHVDSNQEFNVPAGCNVKGDVEVLENGTFVAKYDNDANTGLIVSCPSGCTILAPWGANVTPRDVEDIRSELLNSGCGAKCTTVHVVTISDPGKSGDPTQVPTSVPTQVPTSLPTQAPAPTLVPRTPIVIDVNCDISLEPGKMARVPKGCIVSGDVAVNGTALFDNDQHTGLLVVINVDSDVIAPFGASVTRQGPDVNATIQDIMSSMDQFGCGFPTSGGCNSVKVATID